MAGVLQLHLRWLCCVSSIDTRLYHKTGACIYLWEFGRVFVECGCQHWKDFDRSEIIFLCHKSWLWEKFCGEGKDGKDGYCPYDRWNHPAIIFSPKPTSVKQAEILMLPFWMPLAKPRRGTSNYFLDNLCNDNNYVANNHNDGHIYRPLALLGCGYNCGYDCGYNCTHSGGKAKNLLSSSWSGLFYIIYWS